MLKDKDTFVICLSPTVTDFQAGHQKLGIILENKLLIELYKKGLYRTSHLVQKSGKFSKSGLSENQKFSFLDTRLLTPLKIEKKNKKFQNFKIFSKKNLQDFFVDTKFVSRDLIL